MESRNTGIVRVKAGVEVLSKLVDKKVKLFL
jgi:hypothetical protein